MFRGCDHLWRAWRSSATQTPGETTVVGLEMKPVGEPYAGNPHVRFDVGMSGFTNLRGFHHAIRDPERLGRLLAFADHLETVASNNKQFEPLKRSVNALWLELIRGRPASIRRA